MQKRIFSDWFGTFRKSINGYKYYNDFEKAVENAEKIKKELCLLNSLVCAKNIEEEFEQTVQEYPKCLRAIPIIMAVRSYEIFCQDENGAFTYKFNEKVQSVEQYKYFMRETGIFDMLQNHIISNRFDYVTGVEVGLDSNSRKNRGGHQMESLVESFLKKSGAKYKSQVKNKDIEKQFDVDLSNISAKGNTTKKFDFVVNVNNIVYGIEVNFYTTGGSKLNETARSYKLIAEESKNIEGFKFVWITDGYGWESAKNNLKETFDVLEHLYNIADLENGIFDKLFK